MCESVYRLEETAPDEKWDACIRNFLTGTLFSLSEYLHAVQCRVRLFGDGRRAYYLFGAGDPACCNTPCGRAVLWDGFRALARAGHSQVDLEGVNSPRRGWFQLSFGAELVPYYQLVKDGDAAPPQHG